MPHVHEHFPYFSSICCVVAFIIFSMKCILHLSFFHEMCIDHELFYMYSTSCLRNMRWKVICLEVRKLIRNKILIGFLFPDELRSEVSGSSTKCVVSSLRWHRSSERNQWKELLGCGEGTQVHRSYWNHDVSCSVCRSRSVLVRNEDVTLLRRIKYQVPKAETKQYACLLNISSKLLHYSQTQQSTVVL